jgi:metal-responsive CopG/Arc/MetJ family transcriptional regulator
VRNYVRMTVRTNLLLPRDLVERVDKLAGRRGRSRFVAEVLESALRREAQREAIRGGAGLLKGRPGYEHWSASDRVVEWVDKVRAEDRDPWAQ